MKTRLWLFLKILLSSILLYYVLQGIDAARLQLILQQAQIGLLVLAAILYGLGQMVSAYRWKILLKPLGLDVSYRRAIGLYFLGMFFNLFFPTLIGGDAVKVYYLTREGGGAAQSTTSVLMDRNTGLGALLLLAVVVAGVGQVRLENLLLFLPLLGLLGLFGLANLILFYDPTYHWLAGLFERVGWKKLVDVTQQFHTAFITYRRAVPSVIGAIGLSLIFDVALIAFPYLAAQAIGWTVAFKYFCVFIPLISVISMAPITLYGLGLREFLFVEFFSQVGMSPEASLLLAFLYFFVILVTSLPGALVYILYRRGGRASS